MTRLPDPEEPDMKTLKSHGANYEDGVGEYLNIKDQVDSKPVGKRAVIDYLWEKWDTYSISYQELAAACGDANITIDQWIDGEKEWEDVLQRVKQSLGSDG